MTSAIVIGGGIAGCSTAYSLAQRGIAVTLIERHENIANGASGNPLAMLYPKLNIKLTPANTLALQGFNFTLNLIKSLPNAADYFDQCGQIQLAFNAREATKQAQITDENFNHLNAIEASHIAGLALKTGGLYLPTAGWVKPQTLCKALIQHANISLQANSHALSVTPTNNRWQVKTYKKILESDIVVICNANDVKQFGFCQSAQITPVRGQLNWFKSSADSENIKAIICSDQHISPAVDGWHYFGTTYAPNDKNPYLSEADTLQNLNALRKILPELYQNIDINSVQGRVAWRSQTLDYMPLAGQLLDENKLQQNPPRYNAKPDSLPWLKGLYVNAGHGSKGMITAPLCGEIIACLATQSALPISSELASKLNPSRFLLKQMGLKQLANSLYQQT
jgi:tRNA 5-methylaminomethyl-2-thiouridine biosynthesis bifunctional protein